MFQKALAKRDQGGFTLIELLVVMIIIGLLAGVAIPVFLSQKDKSKVASLKADLRNAATYAETYAVDNNGSYVSFDLSAVTEFKKSSNTTSIAEVDAKTTATRFCIEGAAAGSTWSYDSTRAVQLGSGACA